MLVGDNRLREEPLAVVALVLSRCQHCQDINMIHTQDTHALPGCLTTLRLFLLVPIPLFTPISLFPSVFLSVHAVPVGFLQMSNIHTHPCKHPGITPFFAPHPCRMYTHPT